MKIKMFQEGGVAPMAPEGAAPTQDQGAQQDPLMQIAQMFAQGLQSQDCAMLSQGAQAFLQLVQQSGQGAPAEQTTQPVYAKGGKFKKRIPKDTKEDGDGKGKKPFPFQKK